MNQVWNLEDKLKYINCKLVNHDQDIILFCLRKDCTKSRLLCEECLPLHVGHDLYNAEEIQQKIDKIHCVQNQSAKKALQLFQEFKTKLLIHVDQIEKYIMDSCQLPNSTLEFNQMRSKLISEEGININEMEQMLNKLINDQQPETVNYRQYASNSILTQYVQQFNRWLQQMPKISQKLEKCVFLKEPNQGFGICYSNKISKSNYLMQPFTSLENSLLSSITIGKANVANPQNEKLNLKIIMGLDLDQVIFEEEFTIQSIKQNIYKWELQFTKPIQLIRENMYSIIATTNQNEEYTICDFKQQEIINPYIRNEIIDCQTFINKPGNVELTMKIFVSDFTLLIRCISSNKNDNESIDRFSCSFSRSVTLTQARCESLSQIYKIGKYMKIARNDKMDEMWRNLLQNIEDSKEPPINQYNNKLGTEQQLNQPEYRIVANKEDYNMLILYASDKEQFKIYGFMGISQNIRWSYWKTVTLAEEINQISQKSNWEKFSELFYTLSVDTNSIEKDITRTRIDTFFNHDIAISKLNMILKAIANEHPNVGYCQGMNYVAALLLMVSGGKEFECFIVFSHLISSPFYLLGQLFSEGLILLQVIEFIINQLMQEKLTKLFQHFQVQCIPNSFWLSKILLSGFVYIFKVQECVLFWDYILIRGTIKGFIELILAMLIVQEKELLLLDDLGIAEFFSFQEGKQAEPIIRQALQNDQIADDVIRKLAKKSKLKSILNRFGKKDFNSKFQQCK